MSAAGFTDDGQLHATFTFAAAVVMAGIGLVVHCRGGRCRAGHHLVPSLRSDAGWTVTRIAATCLVMLACGAARANGEVEDLREYRDARALAAAGKEEGVSRLFELMRSTYSAELQEDLVVALYECLRRTPEVWIRAVARRNPRQMSAFLMNAGLGNEIPASCPSRAVCSAESIARLSKFRGSKREQALASEVIAALERTRKGWRPPGCRDGGAG